MKQRHLAVFALLLLVCTLIAGAHADIKYSQTMTMGGGNEPFMHSTHYIADGKERDDNTMKMGTHESTESRIHLCKTNQRFLVDRALKIYAVEENSANKSNASGTSTNRNNNDGDEGKPGEGKVSVNIKITDLPNEKVAGFDTHHFISELHTKTSGCIGNSESTIKMEMWISNIRNATACKEKAGSIDYAAILGQHHSSKCKVTYETTGDATKFNNAWNGIVLRHKMYQNGKLTMVTEVTSLSQAKLDDDVFEVPAGFTKLSEKEYNERRQKAMMEAMMSGAANAGNSQSNDATDSDGTAESDGASQSKKSKAKKSKTRRPRFKLPF